MAIAYFSTWTTYGTWLPGDERGWFAHGKGLQAPDLMPRLEAELLMTEDAVTLDDDQRRLVEDTIAAHSAIRQWTLHAVHCRSNHVHVVVTAGDCSIEVPREQFKAWCTRNLKEYEAGRCGNRTGVREKWWTQRGWDVYIDNEAHLQEAMAYVIERQTR